MYVFVFCFSLLVDHWAGICTVFLTLWIRVGFCMEATEAKEAGKKRSGHCNLSRTCPKSKTLRKKGRKPCRKADRQAHRKEGMQEGRKAGRRGGEREGGKEGITTADIYAERM